MFLFNSLIKLLATVCGAGYLPLMPGTFGSLVGLAVYFVLRAPVPVAVACGLAVALGFLVSGKAERILGQKDSRHVVIDEVAGILLGLLFIPFDVRLAWIGFLMFRILDTLKPFPAGRLQELKGSTGIMLDDIVAGLYTNLILQLILCFI